MESKPKIVIWEGGVHLSDYLYPNKWDKSSSLQPLPYLPRVGTLFRVCSHAPSANQAEDCNLTKWWLRTVQPSGVPRSETLTLPYEGMLHRKRIYQSFLSPLLTNIEIELAQKWNLMLSFTKQNIVKEWMCWPFVTSVQLQAMESQ
jgi:hypothetical protein